MRSSLAKDNVSIEDRQYEKEIKGINQEWQKKYDRLKVATEVMRKESVALLKEESTSFIKETTGSLVDVLLREVMKLQE